MTALLMCHGSGRPSSQHCVLGSDRMEETGGDDMEELRRAEVARDREKRERKGGGGV